MVEIDLKILVELQRDGKITKTKLVERVNLSVSPCHERVKEAIINATELDTRLVMRPLRNTERVLNNSAVEKLLEKEKELGLSLIHI